MPKALDLAGKRFGRLVVLHRAHVPNARNVMWVCQCDCGLQTTGAAANLGKTKFSCGCFKSESATKSLAVNRLAKPGQHGLSQTPEYKIWSKMKSRCTNKNDQKYSRYGGRGIKVCDRWLNSFENFYSDMGPRPSKKLSIDRIDNDGDYELDNCRWTSNLAQSRNKSQNVNVTINGVTMCVVDWCKLMNLPRWAPYELTRGTGRDRNGPPKFQTTEEAVRHLYDKYAPKSP